MLALLFTSAAIAGAAGAPVRPTQVTLMPAIARSPNELVAANTAWTTGEGLGALVGPFLAGSLMALGLHAAVALVAGVAFGLTAMVCAGLRFEQGVDASGSGRHGNGRLRLLDGLRAARASTIVGWVDHQYIRPDHDPGAAQRAHRGRRDRAARDGPGRPHLLGAALGFEGLIGGVVAISSSRSSRLIPMELSGLVFWGLPITVIGLLPAPAVALSAMVVIGVANATCDVALFAILQRACTNDQRAPVVSLLEGVIGLGSVSGSLVARVLLLGLGTRGALVAAARSCRSSRS